MTQKHFIKKTKKMAEFLKTEAITVKKIQCNIKQAKKLLVLIIF